MNLVGQKNKSLYTVSNEVDKSEDVSHLISIMILFCIKNHGLGLAANQIGITKRIIIINTRKHVAGIINPVITKKSPHRGHSREGCLSYPNLFVRKKRHKRVVVTGFNEFWEPIEIKASGLDAFVLQHEIDHLNGVTIGKYKKGEKV